MYSNWIVQDVEFEEFLESLRIYKWKKVPQQKNCITFVKADSWSFGINWNNSIYLDQNLIKKNLWKLIL